MKPFLEIGVGDPEFESKVLGWSRYCARKGRTCALLAGGREVRVHLRLAPGKRLTALGFHNLYRLSKEPAQAGGTTFRWKLPSRNEALQLLEAALKVIRADREQRHQARRMTPRELFAYAGRPALSLRRGMSNLMGATMVARNLREEWGAPPMRPIPDSDWPEERAVLEAVFEELEPQLGAHRVVHRECGVPFPIPDPDFARLYFPQAEPTTVDSLLTNNLGEFSLPDDLFESRFLDGDWCGWNDFHQSFPGAQGLLQISRVGWNGQRTEAAVSVFNLTDQRLLEAGNDGASTTELARHYLLRRRSNRWHTLADDTEEHALVRFLSNREHHLPFPSFPRTAGEVTFEDLKQCHPPAGDWLLEPTEKADALYRNRLRSETLLFTDRGIRFRELFTETLVPYDDIEEVDFGEHPYELVVGLQDGQDLRFWFDGFHKATDGTIHLDRDLVSSIISRRLRRCAR